MKKRIISITLCLIMLLSFTVTPVAANDADSNSITSIEATKPIMDLMPLITILTLPKNSNSIRFRMIRICPIISNVQRLIYQIVR